VGAAEAFTWVVFLLLFGAYLRTLWGESMVARARLYAAALLVGAAGLMMAGAAASRPAGLLAAAVLGPPSALIAAAALGSVTTGMLIGHWYLIDPGMEIEPFRRCFRYFVATVRLEVAGLAAGLAVLISCGAFALLEPQLYLVGLRLVLGPLAALAVAALIRRVLEIPQTMAATGLFYIATLAVLVGEFLGRFLLFRTGLPL
jgi:hypothetical protein